jgi:hypothetical protein
MLVVVVVVEGSGYVQHPPALFLFNYLAADEEFGHIAFLQVQQRVGW